MTTQSDALARLEYHVGRLFVVGVTVSAAALAPRAGRSSSWRPSAAAQPLLNGGLSS